MNVLGLDIGGANIKASDPDGNAMAIPFAMWKVKETLSTSLRDLGQHFAKPDVVGVTMTGELADCFLTRAEGVQFIVQSVGSAFPDSSVRIWLTSGEFATPEEALIVPELAAAANWHALATWAAKAAPDRPAILIDMGSTTTDIIPIFDGRPEPQGLNDRDRLVSGELVYTGMTRTPICAVLQSVPLSGHSCGVAAELFATMADAFVVTKVLEEDPENCNTADGRPLTFEFSLNRLARMVCCDSTDLPQSEIVAIANAAILEQRRQLTEAIKRVVAHLDRVVAGSSKEVERSMVLISGSGSDVARSLVNSLEAWGDADVIDVSKTKSKQVATAACSFAVACLAQDLCQDDLLVLQTI